MFSRIKQLVTDIREAHLPTWLFLLIVICASIGFLDAVWLSIEHIIASQGGSIFCITGPDGGCNIVLQSIYAKVMGIPLSYVGLVYYTAILVTVIRLRRVRDIRLWYFLQIIIGFGFLMSLRLVYIQLFVLYTICPYCMVSAAMSTVMCGGIVWYRLRNKI